jgi:hypothetical protein
MPTLFTFLFSFIARSTHSDQILTKEPETNFAFPAIKRRKVSISVRVKPSELSTLCAGIGCTVNIIIKRHFYKNVTELSHTRFKWKARFRF